MNPPPHRRRRTIRFGRGSSTHQAGFGSRRRGASTEKMGNPSGGSCAPPPSLASRKRRRRWPFSVFPFPRPQQRRSRVWIRIYGTGQNRSKRREDEGEGEASLAGARQQTSWGAAGQRRGREGKGRCAIFAAGFLLSALFIGGLLLLPCRGEEPRRRVENTKERSANQRKLAAATHPTIPGVSSTARSGGPVVSRGWVARWALARRIPSSPVLGGKERRVPCG